MQRTSDYLTFPLTRGHAKALAADGASFVFDPFWRDSAGLGIFTFRITFVSDVPGFNEIHTVSNDYDARVAAFHGVQVDTTDYPDLKSLLVAYGSGEGTSLVVSLNNGGRNYSDVDLGIFNMRIQSSLLTDAILINSRLSVTRPSSGSYSLEFANSREGINYMLEVSPNLSTWSDVSELDGNGGSLFWSYSQAGGQVFFRIRAYE